jgi:hypothetical protein
MLGRFPSYNEPTWVANIMASSPQHHPQHLPILKLADHQVILQVQPTDGSRFVLTLMRIDNGVSVPAACELITPTSRLPCKGAAVYMQECMVAQ